MGYRTRSVRREAEEKPRLLRSRRSTRDVPRLTGGGRLTFEQEAWKEEKFDPKWSDERIVCNSHRVGQSSPSKRINQLLSSPLGGRREELHGSLGLKQWMPNLDFLPLETVGRILVASASYKLRTSCDICILRFSLTHPSGVHPPKHQNNIVVICRWSLIIHDSPTDLALTDYSKSSGICEVTYCIWPHLFFSLAKEQIAHTSRLT